MEVLREIVFDFFFRIMGETSYKNYKLKCELLHKLEHNYNLVTGNREDGYQISSDKKMIVVNETEWDKEQFDRKYHDCLTTYQVHRLSEWNAFISSFIDSYAKRGIDKCVNTTILPGELYWDKVNHESENVKTLIKELKHSICLVKWSVVMIILVIVGILVSRVLMISYVNVLL